MASTGNSTLKSVLMVVIVFVVAVGGVLLGMKLRDNAGSASQATAEDSNAPMSLLKIGAAFPNVNVIDEGGTATTTGAVLGDRGGVVLFMELGCPPCKEMSEKWQKAINSGEAKDIPLYGVTINLPVNIRPYRLKHNLTFPIYSDSVNFFMDSMQVENYPLQVVVGKSGKVESFTFDSNEELDLEKIQGELGQ